MQLEVYGYKISSSPEVINRIYGITPQIQAKITEMSEQVLRGKNSAHKSLNDLIKIYPQVPQFKNLLSVLCDRLGKTQMALEINREILEKHPDYLYGKLNRANEYIHNKQFEKVPEILGKEMELKMLYPQRDEFHVGEVVSFCQTTLQYFVGIKHADEAQMRYDIIEKLNASFSLEMDLFELEKPILALNLEVGCQHYLKQREKAKVVKVIPKKVLNPTRKEPVFKNEIIKQLYRNDLRIDQKIILQILLLPRESLMADLQTIIYDSIARFDYYYDETEWSPQTHEFLNHAILLLVELKHEDSLELLFDVLRQDQNYLDYWFSDSLTEDFWKYVYVLGFDRLDMLKSFVFEPNRYSYSRSIMSEVVVQIALHYPNRRKELMEWYKQVIEEILDRKNDEAIIDTDWIAFVVYDLIRLNATELIPLIKELFAHQLVSEDINGTLEDCLKGIIVDSKYDYKMEIPATISDWYKNILTTWHYYEEKVEDKRKTSNDNDKELGKMLPFPEQMPKVGRNDPCPCGSGKKFKKCCGNE
jgi:hypothetical protein